MLVNVTVIFPQTFQIELPEGRDIEVDRNSIKDRAAYLMQTSQSDPIIADCDIPELEE
jgi:hypothetical protein